MPQAWVAMCWMDGGLGNTWFRSVVQWYASPRLREAEGRCYVVRAQLRHRRQIHKPFWLAEIVDEFHQKEIAALPALCRLRNRDGSRSKRK